MYSGQEWSVGQKVVRVSENGSVCLVPIKMVVTDGSNWRVCEKKANREEDTTSPAHGQSWSSL